MLVALVVLGVFAALIVGGVVAFTAGTVAAAAVAVLILVVAGVAIRLAGAVARVALLVLGATAIVAAAFGAFSAYEVVSALSDTSGAADPPDAAALASADAKLADAEDRSGFRIDLTEDELQAVLQDAIADADGSPLRRVDLTIEDGSDGERGTVEFMATFKGGGITAEGSVGAGLDAGAIELEVRNVRMGRLSLPGLARGAVSDLVDTVIDLNERLAENRADIQTLEVGAGRVLIVGTQGGGEILTSTDLLDALAANAAAAGDAVTPPPERLGPGRVDAMQAPGASYYVALGDSLAANEGVATDRQGYVSRVHRVLEERDGVDYGLANFGVSGETSGTLIRGGQLETALQFIRDEDVRYITIDIGANDLLGHLGSADCESDVSTPACQQRLEGALASYRPNVQHILDELRDAAGEETTIVFLLTYNPFSLGLGAGVSLEADTDQAAMRLNGIARAEAEERGVVVADGFGALQRTTASTTHMLDVPPDIHPTGSGYDLLASAIVDALP